MRPWHYPFYPYKYCTSPLFYWSSRLYFVPTTMEKPRTSSESARRPNPKFYFTGSFKLNSYLSYNCGAGTTTTGEHIQVPCPGLATILRTQATRFYVRNIYPYHQCHLAKRTGLVLGPSRIRSSTSVAECDKTLYTPWEIHRPHGVGFSGCSGARPLQWSTDG